MSTELEQRLYRYDRMAGRILQYVTYVMLGLIALLIIHGLLDKSGIHCCTFIWWSVITAIYHYAWVVCGVIAGLCILCRICLSPFVKSEEQEDFENKLEYVLQQKQGIFSKTPSSDYSPLIHLTSEQENQIKQMLRDLPSNSNKPQAINLALVARFLTALEQLDIANLSDRHSLRLWVQSVTGKQVPSSSQFNEAIPSENRKEVAKLRTQIKQVLKDPYAK